MPISFTKVDWEYTSKEDFIFEANDWYNERYGRDFNDDQIDWMQIIYEQYADDDGDVDWNDKTHDSAWYYYMSEVLGYDDETIDRYSED